MVAINYHTMLNRIYTKQPRQNIRIVIPRSEVGKACFCVKQTQWVCDSVSAGICMVNAVIMQKRRTSFPGKRLRVFWRCFNVIFYIVLMHILWCFQSAKLHIYFELFLHYCDNIIFSAITLFTLYIVLHKVFTSTYIRKKYSS